MTDIKFRSKHKEFEQETIPYMESLYNYALRMTRNTEDASDLLQETYIKAFRFWDKYKIGTNVRAWLFKIMKNTFINRYRKEQREPDTIDYEDIQNYYKTIRLEIPNPDDLEKKLFGDVLEDEVVMALESLPEDFRVAVILCDIEGLPYEEIAEIEECPIGTIRSRIHRGRKMLRAKLFEYAKKRGFISKP